ncbi:hypothetical protein SLS56_005169 [Neofusicoccum ribis]|uniref:Uncharacterized protein n=1 Tax=Neofusicoccum ribis TaxID=45134 RepID=A0ABR3SUG6_9PEZI
MGDAAEPRDSRLAHAFLKGVAKVPIDALKFDHDLFVQHHRPVSEKIVERLRGIFRREGCLRDDTGNWIDALVDAPHLEYILSKNGLREADLRSDAGRFPLLELNRVDCLQGVHRVLAASKLLNPNDRWWTVRLYSKGAHIVPEMRVPADGEVDLPKDACIKIIEGSSNEQPRSDGEIFRKIRLYHRKNDHGSEQKWWARLTATKQKDLRQLLRNSALTHAFDSLIDMPGLWYPVKLGTLHRLLTLRCDEELLNYLSHISRVWKNILEASNVPPEVVDRDTVEKLELLAPSASSRDRESIERMVASGHVFGEVTDQTARTTLLSHIISIPGLIPSLRSFFENLKYLEPCSNILKKMIPPRERRTIFQSLSGSYFAPNEQIVEHAEHRRRRRSKRGYEKDIWLSYVQLWAFCMRHFPAMTQLSPRKELGKDKPSSYSNTSLWHYLGSLAASLGFKTEQALNFQSQDPHEALAEQLLRSAHPESTPDTRLVEGVASILKQSETTSGSAGAPRLTREDCLSVERRCGRPFEDDFAEDKDFLFIPFIYECEPSSGRDVTPFFVKRDMFHSFFGNKYEQDADEGTDTDDDNDDFQSIAECTSPARPHADETATERIQELDQALRRERQQADQWQSKSTRLEAEINGLQRELEQQETNARELEGKIEELQRELHALKSTSRAADLEGEKSRQEASRVRGDMAMLQERITSAVQELKDAQNLLGEKRTELEQARTELSKKEGELKDARNELDKKEEGLSDARTELDKKERELEDARAELREKGEKIDKLHKANESLAESLDSRTAFHPQHPADGGLERDLEDAERKLSRLRNELENSQKEAAEAEKDAQQCRREVEEAQGKVSEQQKAIDDALGKTARLDGVLQATKMRAQVLQEELEKARGENDVLKRDLRAAKEEIDKCKTDLERANSTVAGQKRRLDEANDVISRKDEATAERDKRMENLNHEVQALKELLGDRTDATKEMDPVDRAISKLFAMSQNPVGPRFMNADQIIICPGSGLLPIQIPTKGGEARIEQVLSIIKEVENKFELDVHMKTVPRANWETQYIKSVLSRHQFCFFRLKRSPSEVEEYLEPLSRGEGRQTRRNGEPRLGLVQGGYCVEIVPGVRAEIVGVKGKRRRLRGASARREEQSTATSSTNEQTTASSSTKDAQADTNMGNTDDKDADINMVDADDPDEEL